MLYDACKRALSMFCFSLYCCGSEFAILFLAVILSTSDKDARRISTYAAPLLQ